MSTGEIVICFGVAALFGLLIWAEIDEQKEWDTFSATHECKVVGKQKWDVNVGYGMTANGRFGTVVVSESDKTAYLCNDGVTYWR